jgi:hypothetical protein
MMYNLPVQGLICSKSNRGGIKDPQDDRKNAVNINDLDFTSMH